MRIAIIAPPFYDVPPTGYGGTERVCGVLVDALVDAGADVLLVAAGERRTRAQSFVSTFPVAQPEGTEDEAIVEILHAAHAQRAAADYGADVVHDHTRAGLFMAGQQETPTVATIHSAITTSLQFDFYRTVVDSDRSPKIVAISHAQRRSAPDLPWMTTVHNGVPIDDFIYRDRANKDGFVLYLGRMSDAKGVHIAIEAAQQADYPIVLAGAWTIPSERDYFEREIRPRLGPDVTWLGEVMGSDRIELLSRASCLCFPIQWNEPFGLVMVEAMASGTPVVALRAGSVDEVVIDGITGIVCDRASELADALNRAREIDSSACHNHARSHFSASAMAARYRLIYEQLPA